jgi:hypothetical protein
MRIGHRTRRRGDKRQRDKHQEKRRKKIEVAMFSILTGFTHLLTLQGMMHQTENWIDRSIKLAS